MDEGSARAFIDDDRGAVTGQLTSANDLFVVLIASVLGFPVLAAAVGGILRRAKAFEYTYAAAAALVAVFTLTGVVQFRTRWTVIGIFAVLAAIGAHLWQYRTDRLDLIVVGSVYVMPVSLASVLLIRTLSG
jgi:hypothetical protein